MPRAHRYFEPGYVWHITHRCHRQAFLLKFAKDRRCWIRWLFEARKRYGLCVLNYIVTSNHIHLLVKDQGHNEIADSMQLIAGRTAQQFNQRKRRKGAFWEDRYHATAVATDHHLMRCMVYIDLNMVRAGVVTHPRDWKECGYHEIQKPPKRYQVIDLGIVTELLGFERVSVMQRAHARWIQETLERGPHERDRHWSESLAVGDHAFVEQFKRRLGARAHARKLVVQEGNASVVLREPRSRYDVGFDVKKGVLRPK